MIVPLITAPNPILIKKSAPVKKIDQKIIDLILDMADTFKVQEHPKAVGLAANQVGSPEKIFLALIDKKILPFINPEIIGLSKELQEPKEGKDAQLEGCLSIPGYFGEVKRPKWVKIKYQTLVGAGFPRPSNINNVIARNEVTKQSRSGLPRPDKIGARNDIIIEKTETFSGFPATIILHEMDHLEGHVFTEKLLSQSGRLYKVVKGQNGKEEFEEVNI